MVAAQNKKVDQLKAEQKGKLQEMKDQTKAKKTAIKKASRRKVKKIQLAGGAAATSLRILGQAQPAAPTAQQSRRNSARRGAGTTAADVARGAASTRGFNLSI